MNHPSLFRILIAAAFCAVFALAGASGLEAKGPKAKPSVEPLVVWDGEDAGTRSTGWSSPKPEDNGAAVSTIGPVKGTGHLSDTGLVWKVKGKEWKGFGWNWFSWWPVDAGTDITMYSYFSFWIRFEIPANARPPALDSINLSLSCSSGSGAKTADVGMLLYTEEDLLDGKWHKVRIPLKELLDDDASREFDPRTAWEFDMGTWTQDDQEFTAILDSIGFE
jgi:hypothetical protein